MLRAAFPDARILATEGTIAELRIQTEPAYLTGFWKKLFPGQIPPVEFPEALDSVHFELEGNELSVIEAGHTDTEGTTSLWVPNLRLIVRGDVVYNATYPYPVETTPEARQNWIAALTRLKALNPRFVVSGHKQPQLGDSPDDIDATIQYLRDVDEIAETSTDALDVGLHRGIHLSERPEVNSGPVSHSRHRPAPPDPSDRVRTSAQPG
ncbi:hypothetical protein SAMN05216554_3279 [Herbiconiux ginsengi]|uniref:Metallo-beta-lactamase domain-containing protein n=1 Tax=Herbiconiux ginsengi TaxID=381665 RepID=A0A1H3S4L6_9MICO|nr:hypothetical protein SAMN05216554_3279 [Herbiconiux ginsengi]